MITEKSRYAKNNEKQRRYNEAHKEQQRKRQKEYREKNKEKLKEAQKRRAERSVDYKQIETRQIWEERKNLMLDRLEKGLSDVIKRNPSDRTDKTQYMEVVPIEYIKYDGKFVYLKSIYGKYMMTFTIQQLWNYLIF